MHRFLFILFLLISPFAGIAQSGSVSGTVQDKQTHLPLPGATVSIYAKNDTVVRSQTVTDSVGRFKIIVPGNGSHRIEISFIGFETYIKNISQQTADLGIIHIQASRELLTEVTVTAERSTLVHELDKKIYYVGRDVMASSSTLTEILQNIPSITVDIDGNVTMRNSGNITYFINGRPSTLLGRNPATALEQIPAANIERIEIITNPSAKYRPDGVGGIINIVLKKDLQEGFSGQVNLSKGNEKRYAGSLLLNHGEEKFKWTGSYSARHFEGGRISRDERLFRDSATRKQTGKYFESGTNTNHQVSHSFSTGFNLMPDKFNTIGFSGNYRFQKVLRQGHGSINGLDSLGNPAYSFDDLETNSESEYEGELAFSFEHLFKDREDHSLSLDFSYEGGKEKDDQQFRQVYSLPAGHIETSHIIIDDRGEEAEWTLDYVRPVGDEGEFEAGYNNHSEMQDLGYFNNGDFNRFLFRRKVHAVYAQYGQSWDKFSFKAGLRVANAVTTSHLKQPHDSVTEKKQFKYFPTLHTGFMINDHHQLSLSYSKRISRPDGDELNPNLQFSDPRNAEAGNPTLKPEQTHSFELGYMGNSNNIDWTGTIYYRFHYDAFTEIRRIFQDTIVLRTIENLDKQHAIGLELVFRAALLNKIDLDLTGNVYHTRLDASRLGFNSKEKAISGNLKFNSLVKPWKGTYIQLNSFYFFPSVTPQGRQEDFFYLNGGIRQQLFRNKASLSLTASDIFHTRKNQRTIIADELEQTTFFKRKQPVVVLGFTWRFRNAKEKEEQLEFEEMGN